MDIADIIIRAVLFVFLLYVGWTIVRAIGWLFRSGFSSAHKLPRAAGSAAATAADAANKLKDGFVEGWRSKR